MSELATHLKPFVGWHRRSTATPEAPIRAWPRRLALATSTASVVLLLGAITQCALIRLAGDRWWLATIVMFAPRWPLLVLIAFVSLVAALCRRCSLWVNALSAVIVVWPTMGWTMPAVFSADQPATLGLTVMSFNAGGGVKLDLVREEIARVRPGIVAIQETPTRLPENLFDESWQVARARGLTIASRYPIKDTSIAAGNRLGLWLDHGLRARVATPAGDVNVCCVYMESPREGFESLHVTRYGLMGVEALRQNTRERDAQSSLVREWIDGIEGPKIVAGDFNQPPESHFYRRDWSEFKDAFLEAGSGYGHTWFSSWHGVRIDRVLADQHWNVTQCIVGNSLGGDHRPLVVQAHIALTEH